MQNPKLKLEPRTWYRTSVHVNLHSGRSIQSKKVAEVPRGSLVMFLGYHPGSVYFCKVMFSEYYGWLSVPVKYKDHTHFFLDVKEPS